MSSTSHQRVDAPPADRASPAPAGWVVGTVLFAAITLIMVGFFHVVSGLAALLGDEVYLAGPRYVFSFDLTVWGWIHLLVGVLAIAAGFALRTARTWARAVGITLAAVSAFANFLFIPYYPVWSIVIIALDVLVIIALCLYDRDAARA